MFWGMLVEMIIPLFVLLYIAAMTHPPRQNNTRPLDRTLLYTLVVLAIQNLDFQRGEFFCQPFLGIPKPGIRLGAVHVFQDRLFHFDQRLLGAVCPCLQSGSHQKLRKSRTVMVFDLGVTFACAFGIFVLGGFIVHTFLGKEYAGAIPLIIYMVVPLVFYGAFDTLVKVCPDRAQTGTGHGGSGDFRLAEFTVCHLGPYPATDLSCSGGCLFLGDDWVYGVDGVGKKGGTAAFSGNPLFFASS